ncbi:hypothetical protein [Pseudomonas lutea]|jgi:hypothetical protein|uniref:Uncharacterized protein n=1 Tax=Pseudomonas lutea TaxID=243924 RepID=A0A9X0ECM8_9PSED|nr:hypothetical protein [Pseudomonas lutea]KGF63335.1 hypothetical protein LT42_15545 [Pseudomonas lutea]
MSNPFDKATSKAPPTVGEGCLSRYDVDAMTAQDGAEFEGAEALWKQLMPAEPDEQSGGLDPQ